MFKYGREWDDGIRDAEIELACYLVGWPESKGGLGKFGHMKEAAKLLVPASAYIWHKWSDVRMKAWCENDFMTWIGPGSVAKSTDAALVVLIDWLASPDKTRSAVCSTTLDMLTQRIWGEVVRLYATIPNAPGKLVPSKRRITFSDEDNPKAGIFGIPVDDAGSAQEAVSNIVGAHMPRNRLVADEYQFLSSVVDDGYVNMSSSGESKFLGIGNPVSRYDNLGKASEPVMGWDSVSDKDEVWKTRKGHCYFFDGLKSPGVDDPKKYWMFLTQKKIDETALENGPDSLMFWSQRRGFFPPETHDYNILMTRRELKFYKCHEDIRLVAVLANLAAVDLAIALGGDRCIYRPAVLGIDHNNNHVILFKKYVVIKAMISEDQLPIFQIVDEIERLNKLNKVKHTNFAMDTTGLQATAADVVENKLGRGILRVSFQGRPIGRQVSFHDKTEPKDMYKNRVTQLWMTLASFCKHGQVRGFDDDSAKEFCDRRLKNPGKPIEIESKKDMKKRVGYSPDIADTDSMIAALVVERHQVLPGINSPSEYRNVDNSFEAMQKFDFKDNYDQNKIVY